MAGSLPTLSEITKSSVTPVKIQATGKRESLEPKVNGQLEGLARYYHPNGQLYGVIEYHEGKKIGTHTLYREDGSKEQQLSYKNGQPDGNSEWYDANGKTWMAATYENGTVKSQIDYRLTQDKGRSVTGFGKKVVLANLGAAVATRNTEQVKAFLDAKADPNFKYAGNPVLVETLTWGLADIAKLLLEAGADPNAKSEDGKPIILKIGTGHGASDENFLMVAKIFAKYGAKFDVVDSNSYGLIDSLAIRKVPKTLEFVMTKITKADMGHALELALEYGDLDTIKIILAQGADPNQEKVIWKGMHYGPESHRLALMKSARFDKKSPLWIQMAASEGRVETVQELVRMGANIDGLAKGKRTALYFAIENGKNEIVRILLAAGASTETLSEPGYGSLRGETALCLASRKGNSEIVKMLLAAKAEVNAVCGSVETATKAGRADIVEDLIIAGADLKDRYTEHWRALFAAAEFDKKDIGEILIKGGVRVDVRGDEDCTPLMVAASKGSLGMIQLLFNKGASLDVTNSRRVINDFSSNFIGTPLGWAIEHKQEAAAKLLRKLGAK